MVENEEKHKEDGPFSSSGYRFMVEMADGLLVPSSLVRIIRRADKTGNLLTTATTDLGSKCEKVYIYTMVTGMEIFRLCLAYGYIVKPLYEILTD